MSKMGEAIGSIAGLLFAGWVFIEVGRNIDAEISRDFAYIGELFLIAAILGIVALAVSVIAMIVK